MALFYGTDMSYDMHLVKHVLSLNQKFVTLNAWSKWETLKSVKPCMICSRKTNCPHPPWYDIDGLVEDCSNSIANALESLQSCTEPSILSCFFRYAFVYSIDCEERGRHKKFCFIFNVLFNEDLYRHFLRAWYHLLHLWYITLIPSYWFEVIYHSRLISKKHLQYNEGCFELAYK